MQILEAHKDFNRFFKKNVKGEEIIF